MVRDTTKSMIMALQEFHKLKKDVKYIYSQSLQNNKKIEGLLKKLVLKK